MFKIPWPFPLKGHKWVHCFFLFPLVLGEIHVTCKIVAFLCSLENFLLKNVVVWKSHFKMVLIWKRVIFDLLFTYFNHQGKDKKIIQHISHLHTYTYFAHPSDFFAFPNLQKLRIYHVWFLFGATSGVDSYSHHFHGEQNLGWNVYYWYLFKLMENL